MKKRGTVDRQHGRLWEEKGEKGRGEGCVFFLGLPESGFCSLTFFFSQSPGATFHPTVLHVTTFRTTFDLIILLATAEG